MFGHHRKGQGKRDGQPDPQLGACVLQPPHHLSQRAPPPDALGQHHNYRGKADEPREQPQLRRGIRRRSREKQGQQDKRSELRQRTRGHDQTTEVCLSLARIIEDGHQHPERRRQQRDAHQQAIPDQAAQLEPVGDQESQHRGKNESPADEDEDPAIEPPQVYLVAGHKQQETQAQVRCHPDSHVEMHPPQNRRSDQDATKNLQHHRRHFHRRDEPEDQRHRDGDRADDQQAGERDHVDRTIVVGREPGRLHPSASARRLRSARQAPTRGSVPAPGATEGDLTKKLSTGTR